MPSSTRAFTGHHGTAFPVSMSMCSVGLQAGQKEQQCVYGVPRSERAGLRGRELETKPTFTVSVQTIERAGSTACVAVEKFQFS